MTRRNFFVFITSHHDVSEKKIFWKEKKIWVRFLSRDFPAKPVKQKKQVALKELDRVGPVNNRPSTNKLYHFVKKNKNKKTWHVTRDMSHVTRDTWHMTCDMFWGVNILSKAQPPSSYGLWVMILWRSGGKGWLNELMN